MSEHKKKVELKEKFVIPDSLLQSYVFLGAGFILLVVFVFTRVPIFFYDSLFGYAIGINGILHHRHFIKNEVFDWPNFIYAIVKWVLWFYCLCVNALILNPVWMK